MMMMQAVATTILASASVRILFAKIDMPPYKALVGNVRIVAVTKGTAEKSPTRPRSAQVRA